MALIALNFEQVRCLILVSVSLVAVQQLLPICLSQSWEESLELSLKRVFLDHLHQSIVGQDLVASWLLVKRLLLASSAAALLLVLL